MRDKLKELESKAFNEWMEANYQKENLENEMIEAANEGYKAIVIDVSEETNKESRRFKNNPEFIESLKNMFPTLTVSEKLYTRKSYDMFKSCFYDVEYKKIMIYWGSDEE